MYRENGISDEIVDDPAALWPGTVFPPGQVTRHYDRYRKLWNSADDEEDTVAFIRQRIGITPLGD
jgi:hypothetical protein